MVSVLGAVAEFERAIVPERHREGIAKARKEGKFKARAPTARAKSAAVLRLASEGRKREETAGETGIGVASLHRVLVRAGPPRTDNPKPTAGVLK
jgi:DNA invertase Pin-like site-specific DNA recombinase